MIHWHEKTGAKIGLRLAGMVLLASAWAECMVLRDLVRDHAGQDADGTQFLLAALLFATASAGVTLVIVGAGLWKPVQVSARWASNSVPMPVSRDLEPALFRLAATSQGQNPHQESRVADHEGERSPVRHSDLSPSRRGRDGRGL